MRLNIFIIFLFIYTISLRSDNIILSDSILSYYVDCFIDMDSLEDSRSITNKSVYSFFKRNIPLFECPDKDIEKTYYFRWWTYRKHIRDIGDNRFVITEFLKDVSYSKNYGVINCPGGHHIYEGRWLRDPIYIKSYIDYYLNDSFADPRQYSFWISNSFLEFVKIHPDINWIKNSINKLDTIFRGWDDHKDLNSYLYWQFDMRDGMEMTVAGAISNEGKFKFSTPLVRPTINSYMYGDACALSQLYKLLGFDNMSLLYKKKAIQIKRDTEKYLWNKRLNFFTSSYREYKTKGQIDVRELVGYIPWYFNLPTPEKNYEISWEFLMRDDGFWAPYGPTTCEQNNSLFQINYNDFKPNCLWNGPSWPFATTQTLVAFANLLNNYKQEYVDSNDYFKLLKIYALSHRFRQIPPNIRDTSEYVYPSLIIDNERMWIDESIDPYNGNWFTRYRFMMRGIDTDERGKDYNHSGFCDLVISGLIGLRPQLDDSLIINPLIPSDWDYFCLDNIRYKNHDISIVWDKNGEKYNRGRGLIVLVDGNLVFQEKVIKKILVEL